MKPQVTIGGAGVQGAAVALPASARQPRIGTCIVCGGHDSRLLLTKRGFDVVRCRGCSLVYVTNPPSPSQLAETYSVANGYHAQRIADEADIERPAVEWNLRFLERVCRSGDLLDVGCSTGRFLRTAREAGWRCRGVEFSEDTSRLARERYGLEVTTGSLEGAALPSASFDAVTLWDVIEHVPDPRAVLAEAHRVLRDRGWLAITTPRSDGLFPRASLATVPVAGDWPHAEPPEHLFQFSRETLRRLLDECGFSVEHFHNARIPISYTFGTPRQWFRSVRWLAYCAAFIPVALAGPVVGLGDSMTLLAQKRHPVK